MKSRYLKPFMMHHNGQPRVFEWVLDVMARDWTWWEMPGDHYIFLPDGSFKVTQ